MKKIIASFSLFLFFSLSLSAQQNHFVYLQTDNKQPFYVKLDKKILSSSTSGYVIIPKLVDGDYTLTIGFPKSEWAEQTLNVNIQNKDLGFLLKNFNEKGWGLVNLSTFQIINNNKFTVTAPITPVTPSASVTQVKVQEKPKDAIPVVQEEIKTISNSNPKITKLFTSKSNSNIEVVYIDRTETTIDTIRIQIPLLHSTQNTNTQPIVITPQTPIQEVVVEKRPEAIKQTTKEPEVNKEPQIKQSPKEVDVSVASTKPNVGSQSTNSCKSLANEDDYKKLRKKMASADSDNEMLSKALTGFQKQCYTTEQIKTLSFLFLNDEGKYKFLDTAYPFVYDKDNFIALSTLLSDAYYIKRFNAMLKN